MATFKYKAKELGGRTVRGSIIANDEAALFRELEKKNLYCLSYKEVGATKLTLIQGRLPLKKLNIFCRELGIMISAGVPVMNVLNVMYRRSKDKKLKAIYMGLMEQIETGSTLADSMKTFTGVFPDILIAMIRVGEQSGSLDKVLMDMSEYYSKENETKSKAQTVMIYPAVLLLVTVTVVIALFTYVLPRFFSMFEGKELSPLTKTFMNISNLLVNDWQYLLMIILALVFVILVIDKTKTGHFYFDKMKCNIPIASKLLEKGVIARFANTMGITTNNGIPVLEALEICSDTLGNTYTYERMRRVRENVEKGIRFSESLESEGLFEDMVWSMIATGEETGKAGEMYERLYSYYSEEADMATQKLLALLEPLIMVVIGGMIALVMVSILGPIYGMYS